MNDSTLQAQIDAATAYQEFFVPALFQEWAPWVAAAANLQPGQRVLDVACGTGVLARVAAACVGAGGAVCGLDANPGMLAVAARLAPESAARWYDAALGLLPMDTPVERRVELMLARAGRLRRPAISTPVTTSWSKRARSCRAPARCSRRSLLPAHATSASSDDTSAPTSDCRKRSARCPRVRRSDRSHS